MFDPWRHCLATAKTHVKVNIFQSKSMRQHEWKLSHEFIDCVQQCVKIHLNKFKIYFCIILPLKSLAGFWFGCTLSTFMTYISYFRVCVLLIRPVLAVHNDAGSEKLGLSCY